jgi:hypothetical protein
VRPFPDSAASPLQPVTDRPRHAQTIPYEKVRLVQLVTSQAVSVVVVEGTAGAAAEGRTNAMAG